MAGRVCDPYKIKKIPPKFFVTAEGHPDCGALRGEKIRCGAKLWGDGTPKVKKEKKTAISAKNRTMLLDKRGDVG